ncbi:MAG: TIGR02186 family protein [Alphaproteobacteria bacterium]
MIRILTIFAITVLFPNISKAQTNDMAVEIASDHIDITVGFAGATIELFGSRADKNTKIAIAVEGPKKDITVWRKERVLGAWMNRYFVTFNDLPAYYQYAVSHDNDTDEFIAVLNDNGIGNAALIAATTIKKSKKIKDITPFTSSLLQKKTNAALYFDKPSEFKFINDNFFRVQFSIPPSAMTGEYKIHSYLIKNGEIIQHNENTLEVKQVGLNASIVKSSKDYSFFYALLCITLGLFSGWFVSVIKVRP